METTKFYEVLETLRRRDAASPTGYESDRAFAERIGVANKTITLYRRGALPKAETIKKIAQRGGYSNDDMFRLLAGAAGGENAKPISDMETPVYHVDDMDIDGPKKDSKPLFSVSVPMVINALISRSSLVGIMMREGDVTCEPLIPAGSVVVYSNGPCDPENRKMFVFNGKSGPYVAMMRVNGRQLWRSGESIEKFNIITTREFEEEVMGQVVLTMNLQINIPGVTKKEVKK